MPTTRGLDRLVFFTDAVTAIAITLLILPLVDSVTDAANSGTSPTQFLGENAAELAAFGLSFVVIARLWISHHSIFEHVAIYNRPLLMLSLCWAFTVVFLPLPTAMVSQFETVPAIVALYIGTMAVSSLTLTVMALLVQRHPLLELEDNPFEDRKVFASIVTTAGFVVALLLGTFVPVINFYALLVLFLGGPLQAIYDRRADARRQRSEAARAPSHPDPLPPRTPFRRAAKSLRLPDGTSSTDALDRDDRDSR